ncbi:GGDEF domain-containing protein [Nocardia sp. CNY236]|uniref:GGDEF domain-containing protein n=1 Tax=Nocardia sp. CNY236 TaxID=1169152 RepID=UPI000401E1A5|nr:GGDEF domain-containing protein [Nocardia sp. CNY236]
MKLNAGTPTSRLRNLGAHWYAVLLAGSAATIIVHLTIDAQAVTFATIVIVVGQTLALVTLGVRTHRPVHSLPWYLLSASSLLFATGVIARHASNHAIHPIDDTFTLLGYLGAVLAALIWLRPRELRDNYDLALDSALIGLSALLASWTFLISPILQSPRTGVDVVLATTYPVVDTLLLTVVAHSMATSTRAETSRRLLHAGLIAMLLGDLGYNLHSAGTVSFASTVLQAPLLAAFAAAGIAALHPSMAILGTPRPIHPHRSRQRANLVAIALIVASLVPVVGSRLELLDRVVVSSLFTLLLIGMLVRSERAIVHSTRSERRAKYQAEHDMLTGLLNRTALLRTLRQRPEGWIGQPLCLLFIDLDGFKRVNDSYGHSVGDELLATAAARIQCVVRSDDVVSRYGGDEFVVLSPLPLSDAALLAERLIGAFVRPFELSAGVIPITASVGVAGIGPQTPDVDVHDLIRSADTAMYHAKRYSLGYAFHDRVRHMPANSGRRVRRTNSRSAGTESVAQFRQQTLGLRELGL